jgi:hypothetical protein
MGVQFDFSPSGKAIRLLVFGGGGGGGDLKTADIRKTTKIVRLGAS